MAKHIVFIQLFVLLSACGYQLRGQAPSLAMGQSIWIEAEDSELSNLLKKSILQSKAILLTDVDKKNTANSIIALGKVVSSQSASAYDSQGDVIEYNIYYKLAFTVNGKAHTFNSTLSYQYNKSQLLSSEQNKKTATREILDQAVAFIIRQL